jgi:6-pyruvoyltetrahydropterin/6-carboxytetrahydropterin synthase
MHTIKILTDFSAAHSLRDYPGDCANMHGHNWHLEISVSGELNASGMVMDFRTLKEQTKIIIDRLDHKYINEVKPFDELNPTAENIAKYVFDELSKTITTKTTIVKEVGVWENARSQAIYSNLQQINK